MIRELVGKTAPAKLQHLLETTLLACEGDYADLSSSLEHKKWAQAAKKAHSLKTTASLMDCQHLVHSLEMIEQENLNLISQPSFQQQLNREYLDCLDTMRHLLDSSS